MREIDRHQDLAQFELRRSSGLPKARLIFCPTQNQDRTGRVADDSFRRAPKDKMPQTAVPARRQDDQIRPERLSQAADLLGRSPGENMAIIRPELEIVTTLHFGQSVLHER